MCNGKQLLSESVTLAPWLLAPDPSWRNKLCWPYFFFFFFFFFFSLMQWMPWVKPIHHGRGNNCTVWGCPAGLICRCAE